MTRPSILFRPKFTERQDQIIPRESRVMGWALFTVFGFWLGFGLWAVMA